MKYVWQIVKVFMTILGILTIVFLIMAGSKMYDNYRDNGRVISKSLTIYKDKKGDCYTELTSIPADKATITVKASSCSDLGL